MTQTKEMTSPSIDRLVNKRGCYLDLTIRSTAEANRRRGHCQLQGILNNEWKPPCTIVPKQGQKASILKHLTREIFVLQACELLAQSDRNDIPISLLLESCGAKKGSLYYFFPNGKDELVVAAVERMRECAKSHIKSCLESTDSIADAVYKQLSDLARCMESEGSSFAIPFTAVASITGTDNETVRIACEVALQHLEKIYTQWLKNIGLSIKEARSTANFIITSVEGAFLLSRTQQSSKPLKNAAIHLRQYTADCISRIG